MKKIITILFVSITIFSHAQNTSIKDSLSDTKSVMKGTSGFSRIFMTLYSSSKLVEDMSQTEFDAAIVPHEPNCMILYKKNKEVIDRVLRESSFRVGGLNLVKFSIKNNKDTCIHIGSFLYGNEFNTARTDERARGKKVLSELILPYSYKIAHYFFKSSFKYIVINAAYNKKDFGGYLSAEGCCITILFKISDLQKLVNTDITEDELLKLSEIFIQDESDFKKVSIEL